MTVNFTGQMWIKYQTSGRSIGDTKLVRSRGNMQIQICKVKVACLFFWSWSNLHEFLPSLWVGEKLYLDSSVSSFSFYLKYSFLEVPQLSVVKTWRFHFLAPGSIAGWGSKIPLRPTTTKLHPRKILDLFRIFPFPHSVPKDVIWVYGGEVEGPPFLVWDGRRAPLISLMMPALYSGLSLGELHQDLPRWEQNKSNWKHSCLRAYHTSSSCSLPEYRRKFLDSVYINMSWGRFWRAEMGCFALAGPPWQSPSRTQRSPGRHQDTHVPISFPSTLLLFLPNSSEKGKALPFSLPPLN